VWVTDPLCHSVPQERVCVCVCVCTRCIYYDGVQFEAGLYTVCAHELFRLEKPEHLSNNLQGGEEEKEVLAIVAEGEEERR
jgi:hypothetical protein